MASEASWQTTQIAEGNAFSENRSELGDHWRAPSYQPMDQHTVASLLQRLVERFEESERLYGEALEELHSRLDQLSQTPKPARGAEHGMDVDTFESVQTQVRDLARRFETETSTPLENFERLGKALAGGLRGDSQDGVQDPHNTAPKPSPFAQSVMASNPLSRLAPQADLTDDDEDAAFPPASPRATPPLGAEQDFDTRLVEMANRLEQSIGSAMPTGTIKSLDTKLDDIGKKIAEAIDADQARTSLEHVERGIADMGQQLSHAAAQFGRMEGIEQHLRSLISRLDNEDGARAPAEIRPAQVHEIAAKSAADTARLIGDDTKKTAERLDAIQRKLDAIGDTSRQSGIDMVSTLEAVNESLNQLARKVDGATPKPKPALPSAAAEKTTITSTVCRDRQPAPAGQPAKAHEGRPLPTRQSTLPDMSAPVEKSANGARAGETKPRADKTSVESPGAPAFKQPGRNRQPDEKTLPLGNGLPNPAPDDLVAAARQAAQAAAARAEERASQRSKTAPLRPGAEDKRGANRLRPLLIVCAAILLLVSAALLYGRLDGRLDPKAGPGAVPGASGTSVPAPAKQDPDAGARSAPEPEAGPAKPKPPRSTAEIGRPAVAQHASGIALPPGVILSLEDPSSPRVR